MRPTAFREQHRLWPGLHAGISMLKKPASPCGQLSTRASVGSSAMQGHRPSPCCHARRGQHSAWPWAAGQTRRQEEAAASLPCVAVTRRLAAPHRAANCLLCATQATTRPPCGHLHAQATGFTLRPAEEMGIGGQQCHARTSTKSTLPCTVTLTANTLTRGQ
ncbi:hypothetical protein Dimus_022174 [Dionaea muscipula]